MTGRCCVLFVLAVAAVPVVVGAQVMLVLDQQPNQVAGTFSDESFDIFLDLHGHSQSVAEDFEVATGGVGVLLEDLVIWGSFEAFSGSTLPLFDDVDVLVHADVNGLPGAVLCAEENVPASRVVTGATIGSSNDEYRLELTLSQPCGLSDGFYWVEIYLNSGIGFDDWFWEWGEVDAVAGRTGSAYAEENPGEQWGPIASHDHALQISGTLGHVACVTSAAELQLALTAAGASGHDDVIQIVQGTYLTPGSSFLYSTSESHELQLLGGFGPGCTNRHVEPSNTVLDGDGSTPVLHLAPAPGTSGAIWVQGLTIQNGHAADGSTAGLEIAAGAGFNGRVVVDHNAILGNEAASGVGGVWATSAGGMLEFVNNLVAGNSSATGSAAGVLSCSGEATWVVHNTVADNTCGDCIGGLQIGGTLAPSIVNNILWGNTAFDLVFDNLATLLRNNDIGAYRGTPDPGTTTSNISLDPRFVGGGSYRLQIPSPVIDQGHGNPPGGMPDFDLSGGPRLRSAEVDMGAYEAVLVFWSGFEDPALDEWSLVVGLDR